MARKGFPIVLSAPSGTGKTTLAHLLNNTMEKVILSVSFTTRAPRGSEENGVDYNFVTEDVFKTMIKNDELLEWAQVHDHYYGSSAEWTKKNLEEGRDVLFDIDVQGGLQVKTHYPHAVTIFITPPSFDELEKRLERRGTDSPGAIRKRLDASKGEILLGLQKYDYVINNEKIDRALFDLTSIIRAHHIQHIDRDKIQARLLKE